MSEKQTIRPELFAQAMFAQAAGRTYELFVCRLLEMIPFLPESGREIYDILEPLGCDDAVLSIIAALDDPETHPAIRRMIFHRFPKLVFDTRKLPAHRPGGKQAALRRFVAVCESSGGMSRDTAVEYIAQSLELPISEVRSAVRDRPGQRKKKVRFAGK